MSNHNSEYIRLKELGKSQFEVAKNESDIRGWTVKNSQGRIMGKVSELLFDIESEKVLYMVLDLTGNEMYLKERKVLTPISVAEINEAYNNITFPDIMGNELTELPTYEKGKVSTRIEDIVQHAFVNTHAHHDTRQDRKHAQANTSDTTNNTFMSNNANSLNQSVDHKYQTVVGVFESQIRAQGAIEHLLSNNFNSNQIQVSGHANDHDENSLTSWFKSVFSNDSDVKTYTDAARTGAVVTVYTSSLPEAELAADILDDHGAMNIKDNQDSRGNHFKSRILQGNVPYAR